MEDDRYKLFEQLWNAQDEAYDLMCEYDTLPHHYGNHILFQTEGHIVDLIAEHPGITVTELGMILKKTTSACSQIVRKLRSKGYVDQTRNDQNNRIYNLCLTKKGEELYKDHVEFNHLCQRTTYHMLEDFSEEELQNHIAVQKMLNAAYREDIKRSRNYDVSK